CPAPARACEYARLTSGNPFRTSSRPLRGTEHSHDRSGYSPPLPFLFHQLAAACAGQRVEARLAIVVGRAPLGRDEAPILETLERGVERSVIDDEDVVGLALDEAGDALAVLRAQDERPQDEQVERPLQMGRVLAIGPLSDRHSTRVSV